MKRPRFENPIAHNAILKCNLPPYGMSFTQRRADNLCNIFRLLQNKDPDWVGGKIERALVPRISYLAAQEFDPFDLSEAIQVKFVVDFMDSLDEDELPLDIFDTHESDYPIAEFTCTRASISFYWWPLSEQAQQEQELTLMCKHVDSLPELKDYISAEDKVFGLDLDDVQYNGETFDSEEVVSYVNEQLSQGAKKVKIIMWINQG